MICIGIDFSINHASATIYDDNNKTYNFVTVFNDTNASIIGIKRIVEVNKLLQDLDIGFTKKVKKIIETEKKTKKVKLSYPDTEKIKLANYTEVVDLFIELILKYTMGKECRIAIEGLSFGSKGNQVFELGQATGIFKRELIREVLMNNGDYLYVVSPPSLKASYLKGNASKLEIFEHFLNEKNLNLHNSVFLYLLNAHENKDKNVLTPTELKSPWNDLVDSYTALYFLEKNIL